MRRQFVRLVLLQVIDDNNSTIRLIPVFSELGPSDLGAIVTEDRSVCGTVFPRGDLLSILAVETDDVDLGTPNQSSSTKPEPIRLTFCLVCHAGGRSGSNVVYTAWVLETSKSSFPPKGSTGDL